MQFYDVLEQTKYKITVQRPETLDQLSDLFISADELKDLTGKNHFYISGTNPHTIILGGVISAEIKKWSDKLDESGKKTLVIDDEELVDVLKNEYTGHISNYTRSTVYARRGNRICYAKSYKRKKTKATQGDVRLLWRCFIRAWYDKFGCWPAHIPLYYRTLNQFKAYKKILGWRAVSKHALTKDRRKFYRQIWDNPEEYMQ